MRITLTPLLILLSQNICAYSFILPSNIHNNYNNGFSKSTGKSSALNGVSIGLGPGEEKVKRDEMDKMIYEEPDHELYRQSRLTEFDRKCDAWFGALLGTSPTLGKVSETILERLQTPVELKDEEKLPPSDPQFTAYVRKLRQPWMPIVPAFGCENYGIPIIRRMAESWRHFDVLGMVETDYSLTPDEHGTDMILDEAETEHYKSILQKQKVWLDSDSCSGRLVYINGRFCPSLSKSNSVVQNLTPEGLSTARTEIVDYLLRLPDGFTDELVGDKTELEKECGTNKLSKLSAPHHNTGDATSQFAINNQQGVACFAALNSVRAGSVALVDIPENHKEDLPIQVLHVKTADGGVSSSSTTDESKGVTHHPRTLIVANKFSQASVLQSTIDLEESNIDDDKSLHLSTFNNGYTQVFLDANATLSHSYTEETGGIPVANVELSGEEYYPAKEAEAARPGLRNTYLESIDVHLTSEFSKYKGTIMGLGGCGRSKIALSTTLLKPNTHAEINGLSVCGGDQTVDMRTTIHHVAHGTVSRQAQKNMVGGRATSTFKGRIRVEESAQQTDSEQLARTLLLSDMAKVWAVPSLEIIADDVSCTHGSTVSDISEEEMFYLRSRGLTRKQARNMLMYAFVDEIGRCVDDSFMKGEGMLKDRIIARLENLVPKGDRAVMGEYSSV